MSVHGEYSRALEALRDRLRALEHPERDRWIDACEAARAHDPSDLSAAATAARKLLASIAADARASAVKGLEDPRERLDAHCRAILGN